MSCPVNPLERHAYHQRLKEGPLSVWQAMPSDGIQTVPEEGGMPGYVLDLRRCECGSTIAREVGPKLEGDDLAKHIRGTIDRFVKDQLSKSHRRARNGEPYIVLAGNVGTSVFLDALAKAIAGELEKEDEGPMHCPGCTGDHL